MTTASHFATGAIEPKHSKITGSGQICIQCGADFVSRDKRQKYCSRVCAVTARTTKQKVVSCLHCHKPFKRRIRTNKGGDYQKYCSRQCSFEHKHRVEPTLCEVSFAVCSCGKVFRVKQKNHALCSDECRQEKLKQDQRKRYTPVTGTHDFACVECGANCSVKKAKGTSRRVFCSARCSRKAHKRARKAGERFDRTHSEAVTFAKVWEKDRGKCYICGHVCRRDLSWPHPLSPTVEHVIPISIGG